MLFGRVTDYNVRSNLRAPAVVTRNQNPFFKPGFTELDQAGFHGLFGELPTTSQAPWVERGRFYGHGPVSRASAPSCVSIVYVPVYIPRETNF
jgi:hypothetical protein